MEILYVISSTKCMAIAKQHLRYQLVIENTTTVQIMSFEYRECRIMRRRFLENKVKAEKTLRYCQKYTKMRTASYDVWCDNKRYLLLVKKIILSTAELKTLSMIAKYILKHTQRSPAISEKCQTDKVVRRIRKRRTSILIK